MLLVYKRAYVDDYDVVDAGSVHTSAAVRRASLQCSTSSATVRSKPPPPVRRTSSITGSRPMMIQYPTADSSDERWRGEPFSPTVGLPPGAVPCGGRLTSPRHTPPPSRVAPRRSLSSAYADLCETLNSQLSAGGGGVAWRPGARRSSAVDSSSSTETVIARRQSSADVSCTDSLLRDIKRGVCLRPTVSNDRSAPSIRRT